MSDILPPLYGLYVSPVTLLKEPVNLGMLILLSKAKKIKILILMSWQDKHYIFSSSFAIFCFAHIFSYIFRKNLCYLCICQRIY